MVPIIEKIDTYLSYAFSKIKEKWNLIV